MSQPRTQCGVFISYRRQHTPDTAGWLYDRLVAKFGKARVFMDVDTIPSGVPFDEAITEAVSQCAVLLALIGPEWCSVTDDEGKKRIDNPSDRVRLEIETALKREHTRVVPVLVDGASIPRADDLPRGLRALNGRQALELDYKNFRYEVPRLIESISPVMQTGSGRFAERWKQLVSRSK
jgi:hypothetical protein